MNIKPILFKTPMVQAILDGRKTQTRRIVKPQPKKDLEVKPKLSHQWDGKQDYPLTLTFIDENTCKPNIQCESSLPKCEIGDILWVRETFGRLVIDDSFVYKADCCSPEDKPFFGWKPSIHMPKEAARIFLKVTDVRVERLQDLNRGDAMEEGCPFQNMADGRNPMDWFAELWQSINGKDSWNENPFVWVYEFEIVDKPENFIP